MKKRFAQGSLQALKAEIGYTGLSNMGNRDDKQGTQNRKKRPTDVQPALVRAGMQGHTSPNHDQKCRCKQDEFLFQAHGESEQ